MGPSFLAGTFRRSRHRAYEAEGGFRGMRGLVALSLVLTLASLSGCVSLVEDGSDPDLEAAAADADRALDDYQAKAGHIAGLVSDATGTPLVGALVDLVGIQSDVSTDDKGHFAFLDLA